MFDDLDLNPHQRRALTRGYRPIEKFVEDYLRFRRCGWTHREIASELGYRNKKTVSCLVTRARRYGLLPRSSAVAVIALPGWMGHINGAVCLAVVAFVFALAVVGVVRGGALQEQQASAERNRELHAEDTVERVREALHRAQTGGGL